MGWGVGERGGVGMTFSSVVIRDACRGKGAHVPSLHLDMHGEEERDEKITSVQLIHPDVDSPVAFEVNTNKKIASFPSQSVIIMQSEFSHHD